MSAWTSGQDIAEILGVPIGTVWRWANEDEWPRTKWGRHVLYSWESACDSYDRRRPDGEPLDTVTSGEAF